MVSTPIQLVVLLAWVAGCWAVGMPQQRLAMREASPEDPARADGFRWLLAKSARGKRAARLALLVYLMGAAGGIGWAAVNGLAMRARERMGGEDSRTGSGD